MIHLEKVTYKNELDVIRLDIFESQYAWLCYANDNEAARRMYAGFGFEEVPEAYDEDDGEMPAVLKL